MPHNPTRLNLTSSGRQIPPEEKEKSKLSPTFLMEKVGWQKERDPFSSCSFKESARRAELASKKKAFQYSSILKGESSSNLIASILATPGELPELNLEDVKLEGKPETKEHETACPFSFQGKIKKGGEEIFFLSKDEKSYSVRIGEVIEGYKLLFQKGDTLVISKGSNLFTLPLSYRNKKKG